MKEKTKKYDVGIIVGRFHLPELHEAHIDLIESVLSRHPKVIIFLGVSPIKVSKKNPLDFESRKQMILEKFPKVNVLYMRDEREDAIWSAKLDSQIRDLIGPRQSACLYGGRDSFIPHYKGKFDVIELEPTVYVSATAIRQKVSNEVQASADFRAGAIWATNQKYPTCYPTVDAIIHDVANKRILLGRKPNETKYRFIGGFAEPNSESYELDASREIREETGIEVSFPVYIGSCKIKDWRYRDSEDQIKTLLFYTEYLFGSPQPNDDIDEVKWFSIDTLTPDSIVEEHRPLLEMFIKWAIQFGKIKK